MGAARPPRPAPPPRPPPLPSHPLASPSSHHCLPPPPLPRASTLLLAAHTQLKHAATLDRGPRRTEAAAWCAAAYYALRSLSQNGQGSGQSCAGSVLLTATELDALEKRAAALASPPTHAALNAAGLGSLGRGAAGITAGIRLGPAVCAALEASVDRQAVAAFRLAAAEAASWGPHD